MSDILKFTLRAVVLLPLYAAFYVFLGLAVGIAHLADWTERLFWFMAEKLP